MRSPHRCVTQLAVTLFLLLFAAVSFAQEPKNTNAKGTEAKPEVTKTPHDASFFAQKVQSFYEKTQDYQATFVQTYRDIAAGTNTVSKGKVYIKQPGKMRWDYYQNGKREKLYVSNGKDFWVYEFGFNQVFKQCLKDSQLKTSLAFLTGSGDLQKEFNIELHKKSTEKLPRLRLKPKKPTPQFKEIEFQVDAETGQVRETVLYDPYGNSNTVTFRKAKVNLKLPDDGFEFTPPKGARILHADRKCS